jgi:phosphoglycolate phosphatase-like HAD superfamily hydrolase
MSVRRLILWDIDGTLVWWGPIGRGVFDDAIQEVVGRDPGGHGVSMGGKTDPQIALEIMDTLRLGDGEAATHLPDVLDALHRRTAEAEREFRTTGGTHPGVEDVLARLAGTPGVIQTVLTGNVEPNMRVKLRVFGLDRWLDLEVAATGSDSPDRRELVPIAMRRVADRREIHFEPGEVWVVGDTARDLECARVVGARCALVATGRGSDDLRALGADVVWSDLSDVDAVVRVLAPARDEATG